MRLVPRQTATYFATNLPRPQSDLSTIRPQSVNLICHIFAAALVIFYPARLAPYQPRLFIGEHTRLH